MDETETVILCVCATMSLKDIILSHVFLYVCVVSLITKLFCELKALKPFNDTTHKATCVY